MNIEETLQSIADDKIRMLIASMHNTIVDLQEENRSLKRQLFARKSEQMRPADPVHPKGSLFDEAEALAGAAAASDSNKEVADGTPSSSTSSPAVEPKKERKPRTFSAALPRETIVHDLPEDQKTCPCGCRMRKISEETVEKLAMPASRIYVKRHVYIKYACESRECLVTQPKAEASPIPGSSFDVSILAWILSGKFALGLPLYRIEGELKSLGAEVSRVTLARLVIRASEVLEPLYNHMRAVVMSSSVVCADETRIQVLEGKKRADSDSFMWVACTSPFYPTAAVFMYDASHSADAAKRLLDGFSGRCVIADGYAGYNAFFAANSKVKQAGCWAHARRKFDDAMQAGVTAGVDVARAFVEDIGELFLLERKYKSLATEDRLRERKTHAPPILERIRARLDHWLQRTIPSGKLGRALVYLQGQWETLQTFLSDGDVPLSNNHCENMIRPFVTGRKAWLFSASESGAHSSAILYSLAVTARQHEINTEYYFRRVLTEIADDQAAGQPTDYAALMPWVIRAEIGDPDPELN
ncbi:MAG: IS66 family transposase [Burkholderiaceae bacterium]